MCCSYASGSSSFPKMLHEEKQDIFKYIVYAYRINWHLQYRLLIHNTLLFQNTYKWKVSLNFGDQLLLLDFVECFRRLSLRCGPIRLTSTKGRNMPVVCHFRLLAATTVQIRGYSDINEYTPRVGNISTEIKHLPVHCFEHDLICINMHAVSLIKLLLREMTAFPDTH